MSDDSGKPTKGGFRLYAQSPWGSGNGSGGKGSGGNGGGKNPWGQGRPPQRPNRPNRPQGGQSQELDNVIRGFKEKFGGGGPGGSGGKRGGSPLGGLPLPWIIVGAGLLFMAASSIYIVDAQEESVVLRFGEYKRTTGPGFNLKLPTPIETRITRKTREVQKVNIGGSSANSLMLTGDENIVDIDFTVLWRISSLENYLFEVDEPRQAVSAVAKSAMREIVGKSDLEKIITTDRLKITTDVRDLMQATLDEYKAGVDVIEVQLQKADPPAAGGVVDAFRDVVNAAQDAETVVNQATAYRNDVVPKARGEAAQIIQEAEAYTGRVTAEANGEAERFRLIVKEYKAAPRVTRERMYLETLEEIYKDADKIVLDESAGGGVLPYLSLNELTGKKAPQR